jgi:nitronate monooxygenase
MIQTRLCDLLGIEHPVINAPMAGTATAELAAAVSNAGGFGLIGGSGGDADWLRTQIRATRERTERPFGVGFISIYPGLDALVRVAIEERVAAVAHSFADPSPYVQAAHDAGVKVLAQVQTVAQARVAAEAGVDAIAAQGTEAGGHTGTRSATLPLIPAVVDAVGAVPVIAAGGIADGRGLAAVLMLGAVGIWMGTRFMASQEWAGSRWGQERLLTAGTDDTVLTRAYDLAMERPFPATYPARAIRNEFTDAWHAHDDAVIAQQPDLRAQIRRAQDAGDARTAEVLGGNAVGLIHAVEPAGEIVRRIIAEAEAILRTQPALLLGLKAEG